MGNTSYSIKERNKTDLREPRQYQVILHNDDFTTFDFVVKVLMDVFFKSQQDAELLAQTVHVKGQAIVGIYSLDIAISKINKATRLAREAGFPLRFTYSPIE